jgi:hypothetical protein
MSGTVCSFNDENMNIFTEIRKEPYQVAYLLADDKVIQ